MKKLNFPVIFFVLLFSFVLMSRFCDAGEWNRKGKVEIFVLGEYRSGDTTSRSDIKLELDDAFAIGFGAGYNFNEYVNLNTDIFSSSMDATKDAFGTKSETNITVFSWDLNLDINILKKRFSPLITGGVGLIKFSGGWESGYTFRETDFSYNIGGGLRWNGEHLLIRAVYKATLTNLEDADNSLLLNGIVFSIGYTF